MPNPPDQQDTTTEASARAKELSAEARSNKQRARKTRADIAARRTRLAADLYNAPGERMRRFALRYTQLIGEIELEGRREEPFPLPDETTNGQASP